MKTKGARAGVQLPVHRNLQFHVSYTRSVRHDLDIISYGLYLNLSPLLRR